MSKSKIILIQVVKSRSYSPEVLQPRKQPLHLPSPLVSSQHSPILRRCFYTIRPVWRDHLHSLLSKFLIQWVRVIRSVSYESLRLLVCKNFSESFSDKSDFMRRSRHCVYGHRKTIAVYLEVKIDLEGRVISKEGDGGERTRNN